jgi:hypothetical protein
MWVFVIFTTLVCSDFFTHFNFLNFIKQNKNKLIIAISLSSLIFFFIKPEFRVLTDETNLLSNSQSMYAYKNTGTLDASLPRKTGNLDVLNYSLPTRHPLFSFLTSILHSIIGYNANNPFILNFLLSFFSFFVYLKICQNFSSTLSSASLLTCSMSMPLLPYFISSGGFDYLHLFLILLLIYFIQKFYSDLNSTWVKYAWITALLMCLNRYESIFSLAVLSIFIYSTHKNILHILIKKNLVVLVISTFFTLPILWQRFYYFIVAPNYHGNYYGTFKDAYHGAFSWKYIPANIKSLLQAFSNSDENFFFNPTPAILGCIGLFTLLFFVINHPLKKNHQQALIALILFFFSQLLLILFFVSGEAHFYTQSRLFIPSFFFLISTIHIIPFLIKHNTTKKIIVFAITLVSLISALPFYSQAKQRNLNSNQSMNFEQTLVMEELKKQPLNSILLITKNTVNFSVFGVPSLRPELAEKIWPRILKLYENTYIKDIYLLKRIAKNDYTPQGPNSNNGIVFDKFFQSTNEYIRLQKLKLE